jgi:hypothetical protein
MPQMITFRQFITESNYDKTWDNYGKNISARMATDPGAPKDSSKHKEHFRTHVESGDPTPNKTYGQWIGRTYGSGGINRLEDIPSRVHPALETFHNHKHKLPGLKIENDINRYKSLGDLEDAVAKIPKEISVAKQEHDASTEKARKETSHHEDEHWWIKVPHTEHASKHYGQGTRWCTAANRNCAFNSYNKDGNLHVMIPKKPKYAGEKYQVHVESGALMNEKDQEPRSSPFKDRPSSYLENLWHEK